jgi:DNA modification methylase
LQEEPKPNEPKSKTGRLNTLDGRTWSKYSLSIWDITKSRQETKLKHPAMFPIELCKRLIEIYTREGDLVIDPFAGSGSTLVAAHELGRRGVGVDINPTYVDLAKRRLTQTSLFGERETVNVFADDATNLTKYVQPKSADLCITSPPYWSIHLRKRSADYKEPRPYSQMERDIGNIEDYGQFMAALKPFFQGVREALKPGKRCIVIVMDLRVLDKFIPFHIDVISMMKELGFAFEDIVVWNRSREYNQLRPLGYPYKFIVNKVHEYILIFRKDGE